MEARPRHADVHPGDEVYQEAADPGAALPRLRHARRSGERAARAAHPSAEEGAGKPARVRDVRRRLARAQDGRQRRGGGRAHADAARQGPPRGEAGDGRPDGLRAGGRLRGRGALAVGRDLLVGALLGGQVRLRGGGAPAVLCPAQRALRPLRPLLPPVRHRHRRGARRRGRLDLGQGRAVLQGARPGHGRRDRLLLPRPVRAAREQARRRVDGRVRRQVEGGGDQARRVPHVQRLAARGRQAVAHDLLGGDDALPRDGARPAAHAHDRAAQARRGHRRGRVGRCRAALAVHGELVLRRRDGVRRRDGEALRDGRAAAARALRQAVRAEDLPGGHGHVPAALLRRARHRAPPPVRPHGRAVPLRRAAGALQGLHRHPAAAGGPLPLRLRPHLRRRLRSGLLFLQVGGGPLRRRLRRLRGGRARERRRGARGRPPLPRHGALPGRRHPPFGGLPRLPRPRPVPRAAAPPQRPHRLRDRRPRRGGGGLVCGALVSGPFFKRWWRGACGRQPRRRRPHPLHQHPALCWGN
mmetsp:Transcript_39433/g.67632  ORF Transcript_39433/g.67632 Transcript_39433/m.67632 type:complete len:527 (+) Transcript_39433:822-2402(+)